MVNELDEMTAEVNEKGRDINVIEKQIQPTVGFGTTVFVIFLFLLGIIPGIIYVYKKVRAYEYLQKLQQKLQKKASQIDNFLEQRVVILQNTAALVEKATKLDKDVMTQVAAYRGGAGRTFKADAAGDLQRNEMGQALETTLSGLFRTVENYPELKSMDVIKKAVDENSYLQKEITAAREEYNDVVNRWNSQIFIWPIYRSVAYKNKYTTRVPFSASKEIKEKARGVFF